MLVIPAKAGIQNVKKLILHWTPAFAGVTTFCEFINYGNRWGIGILVELGI